ncbi:hypothetical protein [Anatilimnocola floriformis]|uniref:hypothetical protein n=1 Tax=Anatilimnocola floriformis TaxID=2948575 RepID=UPI0020C5A91A|nr:hypothetical protein [Anatilimnocola floriformis]
MLQIARGTYIGKVGTDLLLLRCEFGNGNTNRPERISGDIFRGISLANFNPMLPDVEAFHGSFYSLGALQSASDGKGFVGTGVLLTNPEQSISIKVHQAGDSPKSKLRIQLTTTNTLSPQAYEGDLNFWMTALRALTYEIDAVASPGTATLIWGIMQDVAENYRKAGVTLQHASSQDSIGAVAGGEESEWDEGELLGAMEDNFSRYAEIAQQPAWRAYLLATPWFRGERATAGPYTTGIMFDVRDRVQRRGAAVFWRARERSSGLDNFRRDFIRTATHELGHVFNLVHPFAADDSSDCSSRSCMNYPSRYPGKDQAYWPAYEGAPLCFSDRELDHLYHNRLESVVMGWYRFTDPPGRSQDIANHLKPVKVTGLELKLRTRPERLLFEFGEPINIEAKLSLRGPQFKSAPQSQPVPDALNPSLGTTTYLIEKPNGHVVRFQPAVRRDVESRSCELNASRPAIYENINLTYGANGFVFTEPGKYRIQALLSWQGAFLASEPLTIGVRFPDRQIERGVMEGWNDETGAYLAVWGIPQRTDRVLGHLQRLEKCKIYRGKAHPLYREAMRCSYYVSLKPARIIDNRNGEPRVKVRRAGISKDEQAFLEEDLLGIGKQHKKRAASQTLPNLLYSNLALAYARFDPDRSAELLQAVEQMHSSNNHHKRIAPLELSALQAKFESLG